MRSPTPMPTSYSTPLLEMVADTPTVFIYVAIALLTTLVLGRVLRLQKRVSAAAAYDSPTKRSAHARAAALAASDMLAGLNDCEPLKSSELKGTVAAIASHVKEEQARAHAIPRILRAQL